MGTGASQFFFPKIFFAQPVNIWKESNVKQESSKSYYANLELSMKTKYLEKYCCLLFLLRELDKLREIKFILSHLSKTIFKDNLCLLSNMNDITNSILYTANNTFHRIMSKFTHLFFSIQTVYLFLLLFSFLKICLFTTTR